MGYFTGDFHDENNRQGQVGFRVQGNRYSFTGHPHYFAYESGAIFDAFPGRKEEIHADYRHRIDTYEVSRERFRQTNCLCGSRGEPWPFVSQLGGTATGGNWGSDPPRNRLGQPLRFIGEVKAFLYCEGAGFLLLYFDPEEETALIRIDWM